MSTPASNRPLGVLVANVTWPEVQAALAAGAIAVLPVGAAAKQHGLHLPMNTDLLQAEWLAERIVENAHAAVWPTLSYGHYPAFVDYPGSCSLSRRTFRALCAEIINDILRAGARQVLVLNTGISTIKPLKAVIARASRTAQVTLVNVYDGGNYRAAEARLREQPRGRHADELETSIMLAIAPEAVRMDEARTWLKEMAPGPLNRSEPNAPNYSPSGVYGDPRLATKRKGEILVRAMLDDLLAMLNVRA